MSTSDVKKLFGTSVRGHRHHLGLSQEELAERANLHRTYISDVERGSRNVSLESIERLASALNISVSTLLADSEQAVWEPGSTKRNPDPAQNKRLVEVLLVEDNADDAQMTRHAFTKARLTNRVLTLPDGVAALDYLFCQGAYSGRSRDNNPKVILLDLNLPKINGIEVLRQIKKDPRTANIPVVILTISNDDTHIAECRRLGAESYIVKPVSFNGLSAATQVINLDWALVEPEQMTITSAVKIQK